MKANFRLLTLAATLCTGLAFTAAAAEKDDHDHTGGPKGGKLLAHEVPRAEFFVEKDRTVTITFYDAKLKPVPVNGQVISATAETKSGKVKLEFVKKGDVLVSKTALPKGDGYNISVQFKAKPDGFLKTFRITYDESKCGDCKRIEYACTCHH